MQELQTRALRAAGLVACLVTGLAVCAGAASAQIGSQKEPIQVTSDKADAKRSEGKLVYIDNVEAVQGQSRMKADRLTIVCDRPADVAPGAPDSCNQVKQMIAESNVYYVTPDEKIRGDRAEYDYSTDTIVITGNPVILSRGDEGVMSGKRLVYEVEKGHATMTGNPGDAKGNRVTGIFLPKSKDQPAGTPAPATAPPVAAPAKPAKPL